MNWIVVRTSGTKEKAVEGELFHRGYECFIPMAVKDIAVSRHVKARKLIYSVLIPRIVFVKAPDDLDLLHVQHAKRIDRSVTGAVFRISDTQMARFAASHVAWLESETTRYRAYIRGLEKKGKKPDVIKPSVDGWIAAMEKVGEALFGQSREAA